MNSRPTILALVVLMACAVLTVPLLLGGIGASEVFGAAIPFACIGFLLVLALLAALIGARRFFHQS